jgi:hemin uptake protein HemP
MNERAGKEENRQLGPDDRAQAGEQRRVTVTNNRLESRDLFIGTRDIVIVHGSDAYHLRLTAQNKLILTK